MGPLIFCVCAAELFSITAIMYFPALLPSFQAEWGLTNTEAGWINGIYYGGYAVSVPILVGLTDRVDPRRIYLLSATLGALSMLGFGWLAKGTWTAAAFRLLAGISFAGTYMPGLKALSERITGPSQSRAVSFYTSSITVGTALSVFLAGWLANRFGWRWAAGLMALGPLAAIALFALAIEPRVQTFNLSARQSFLDFRPAVHNRQVIGYMLGYAVHCWGLFGFRSWMVAFLFFSLSLQPGTLLQFSPQDIATVILLTGVPASILGNEGALRWRRRLFITTTMLISGLIGCLIGFSAGLPFIFVVVLCFLYLISVMADSGSLTAGLVSASPDEGRGRTMGLYSFIGFLMAFLAPLTVGGVLDAIGGGIYGWGLAFATLGLLEISGPIWLKLFRGDREV
ncbi:MAG: MFS transporter [Deltaproteobacteria bacterium]|nr:MAG: MFS transporter [Deltaproteobacteria bacterium]